MSRHLIVVDCETTGLDLEKDYAIEVGWWNLLTDERGYFVPRHDVRGALAHADLDALRINHYLDRIPQAEQDNGQGASRLYNQLNGHTLGGSNPTFDGAMLAKILVTHQPVRPTPWHHRLWDLSAYAAGVLALDYLPGLAVVCELLGVPPGDHTAEADVTATGLCFRELKKRAQPPVSVTYVPGAVTS